VTKDLSLYGNDRVIYVIGLNDLQRNISNPALAPNKAIEKSELTVVGEDLKRYVES